MKVIEHIEKAKNPFITFEIVPPGRGKSIQDITNIVKAIAEYNPPWIDVTSHAAEAIYVRNPDGGIRRVIHKKRPGTVGICGIIQNRFKIDTVAHLLCRGFTREETEDALIELNYLGVHNVLALRGDETNYQKEKNKDRTENRYAGDLVDQISQIRQGIYQEEVNTPRPLDFGVGVAGYPEKHFESPNLHKDIQFLKKKVDFGADYVMTQMFFENKHYFNFLELCRDAGINVPIIPGLKIIDKPRQLTSIPKFFYCDLPDELVNEMNDNPEHIKEIGVNWAYNQAFELMEKGAPGVHFYVMNNIDVIQQVVDRLRKTS
ncbi:MAG: methylenetetrahydrofolate reductase [Halobacteriovoraceae bacterium]|nr:methylenetetrahydrofolate reductase [Halobacteriovoraceae bacterium]